LSDNAASPVRYQIPGTRYQLASWRQFVLLIEREGVSRRGIHGRPTARQAGMPTATTPTWYLVPGIWYLAAASGLLEFAEVLFVDLHSDRLTGASEGTAGDAVHRDGDGAWITDTQYQFVFRLNLVFLARLQQARQR
jgi:hypothetical protein